jgi:hypothetical protein
MWPLWLRKENSIYPKRRLDVRAIFYMADHGSYPTLKGKALPGKAFFRGHPPSPSQ